MELVGPLVQSLLGHITEFLHEQCKEEDEVKDLVQVCDQLRLSAAKQPPDKEEITVETATLGNKFTTVVDNIIIHHISVSITFRRQKIVEIFLGKLDILYFNYWNFVFIPIYQQKQVIY
jgi:hypothetical protein